MRFSMRLPRPLIEKVRDRAAGEGVPMASYIRRALASKVEAVREAMKNGETLEYRGLPKMCNACFDMDAADHAELRRAANTLGMSVQDLTRETLRDAVEEDK